VPVLPLRSIRALESTSRDCAARHTGYSHPRKLGLVQ
jgi:hypothetical protein